MIDSRLKILISSVRKLLRRSAYKNIQAILDKTHAADIAAILSELDSLERRAILNLKLSLVKKSEVISHLNNDIQKEIVEQLDKEQVAAIISEMEKDDAADLLGGLSEELSQSILDSLHIDEKREVTDLMRYPEDTAGGLMSSDYLAFSQDLTVSEVITNIQSDENNASITFYLYVVDDSHKLSGVVSLKEIILSKPRDTLKDIMTTNVVSVPLETDQVDVSKIVERYDFLSVPVVDENNTLMGVITVDDVIDVIREEAQENLLAMGLVSASDDESPWGRIKARFSWLLVTYIGGVICYNFIWSLLFEKTSQAWLAVTAFLPIILAMSSAVGLQSATSMVNALISDSPDMPKIRRLLKNEMACSVVFGVVFGSLSVMLSLLAGETAFISVFMGMSLLLQLLCSVSIATLIPLVIKKLGIDPTVATVSLFLAASNITAVLITFGAAYRVFQG